MFDKIVPSIPLIITVVTTKSYVLVFSWYVVMKLELLTCSIVTLITFEFYAFVMDSYMFIQVIPYISFITTLITILRYITMFCLLVFNQIVLSVGLITTLVTEDNFVGISSIDQSGNLCCFKFLFILHWHVPWFHWSEKRSTGKILNFQEQRRYLTVNNQSISIDPYRECLYTQQWSHSTHSTPLECDNAVVDRTLTICRQPRSIG